MRPKKRLGQHFLRDLSLVQRLIDEFAPRPQDVVVEIGPGEGVLTRKLAPLVGVLHVVELDGDLCRKLAQDPRCSGIRIHHADALRFPLCDFAEPDRPLRLIGNLPYNISTPLLFRLFGLRSCVRDMLFMFQREVVVRMLAAPGGRDYGRLSVMTQYFCDARPVFEAAPDAFWPAPRVHSAVVHLTPRARLPLSGPRLGLFEDVVRNAFGQRRKTLRNSLRSLLDETSLRRIGIDPGRRAETLSLAEFLEVTEAAWHLARAQGPEASGKSPDSRGRPWEW
ncbi:MAG: 16S rRNA (adenine(1518)-N(6)/adenine(1519)-N(6))-dimethyltransferase RsmA [Acidiferrobacteraceae bacterium]